MTLGRLTAPEIQRLESLLDHQFSEPSLLQEAMTHSSVAGRSYERLEFLGDRVLGLVLAEYFHSNCPGEDEGALSLRLHAAARQSTLAAAARKLEIAGMIRVQSGMDVATNESVLSDVMESLMAALYLDAGLPAVTSFVVANWTLDLGSIAQADKDAKSRLQEIAMKRGLGLPRYWLVAKTGPDHAPEMIYAVELDGYPEQRATAGSRKQAEQMAAAQLVAVIAEMEADNG